MAGESDVIKEFLVSLGFKIDEGSFKKFSGGLDGITKDVFKLGLVISGALAATDIFVSKIADGMDKLYFSSKRTGSTIAEMNSFQYAIKQLGGSSEEALSAMEALASFRLQYGQAADAQLEGFGVKPEDVGNSKKSLEDLSAAWQKMVKEQGTTVNAFAQAQALHIPENTFRAMLDPRFMEEENRRDQLLKDIGADNEAAAASMRKYEQTLDDTKTAWEQIGVILTQSLLPSLQSFKEFSIDLAKSLPHLGEGKSGINKQNYSSFSDYIDKRGIGGFLIDSLMSGGKTIGSGLAVTGQVAAIGAQNLLGAKGSSTGAARKFLGGLAPDDKTQSSLDFWMSKGYTREQAAGWVSNEMHESGGNPNAEKIDSKENSRGLFQWSLERRAAILKNFGINIDTADRGTQLQAAYLEAQRMGLEKKIKGISGAYDSGAYISRKFEVPADGDFQASIRGADAAKLISQPAQDKAAGGTGDKNVEVTQNNHVTINAPSSHAQDIAYGVTTGIGNQSNNLVDTMKSAVH